MEAGELGVRHSGIPAASSFAHFDRRPRERIETSRREAPTMATAIISPSDPYLQHHTSYGSGYPHSAPATSIPSMISPVEPRRPTDDNGSGHAHRQSLPSIKDVISGTQAAPYVPPTQISLSQGLPSPFTSSAPPRPFGEPGGPDKNPSPRTLYPPSSTYARSETLSALPDPARPPLASRPVNPPLNTFSGHQHPSPPVKLEQLEAEQRQAEAHSLGAGHRPQSAQPLPALYPETGRLPPGQLPLSAYPVSPRHAGPSLPSPYDSQRPTAYGEESDYAHRRLSDQKADFDKHFQTWGYQDALEIIGRTCRTGYHFAEAYVAAAREQQGSQPIPSRMPTENEVTELLSSLFMALKKLEDVRDMLQQNRIHSERARDSGGRKPEDEDVAMYGDGIKPAYTMNEVKKRRGRAAPPGRCHSCNRIDTPEWRRGPDGARTLCNACGLHYAKLERKRQMDQRSLRPKPSDERK